MDDYPFLDGLLETTDADLEVFDQCFSQALPLSKIWDDSSNGAKFVTWDSEFERFLKHRKELIDYEGRETFLPWRIYSTLNLKWLDGYAYKQQAGDCASFSAKNSLKASNLTNALLTGRSPIEIAPSITYAIARGNGTPRFGNGLNLNPLSKWLAEVGNFWTVDFGRYDGGRNVAKLRDNERTKRNNALTTQSIICYLPEASFEACYLACSAGFGVTMGTGRYPISATVNGDGFAVPGQWKSGGHAMAFTSAFETSGRQYIYLENSHDNRYVSDRFARERQPGVWIDRNTFLILAQTKFKYGTWHVNIGELPK